MFHKIWISSLSVLVLFVATRSHASSSEEIAKRLTKSTVIIRTYDEVGKPLGQGSGFFFAKKTLVVTNHHVIDNAVSVEVVLENGEVLQEVELVDSSSLRDLAVLQVPPSDVVPLRYATSKVNVGQKIFVCGNPRGMESSFSEGIISAKRVIEGTSILQISAPISPGSSGGPVVNSQGDVVGVVTAFVQGGQNLNLAVDVKYLSTLVLSKKSAVAYSPRAEDSNITQTATVSSARVSFIPHVDPSGSYIMNSFEGGKFEPFGLAQVVGPKDDLFLVGFSFEAMAKGASGSSAFTFLSDGGVSTSLGEPLEGGFVEPGILLLAPPGTPITPTNLTKTSKLVAYSKLDSVSVAIPAGVYSTNGNQEDPNYRGSETTLWRGWVGLLSFPKLKPDDPEVDRVLISYALKNSAGGGVRLQKVGYLRKDGFFWHEGIDIEGDKPSTYTAQGEVNSGRISIEISQKYWAKKDNFLDRIIKVSGSKQYR